MKKKALVIIYPLFAMQEIACLTEIISFNGKEIVTCSKEKELVKTEDGFSVMPDLTLDEVNLEEYEAVILPGIANFPEVLIQTEYSEFLAQLKSYPEMIVAAISSSVVLLAKAGLLNHHQFTGGFYEEVLQDLPFIPKENFVNAPFLEDGKLITAFGFAYREFAFLTAKQLQLVPYEEYFGPLQQDWSKTELLTSMDEANRKYWDETLPLLKEALKF